MKHWLNQMQEEIRDKRNDDCHNNSDDNECSKQFFNKREFHT